MRTVFGTRQLQSAAPGMSRLAAALVGGRNAQQSGYDAELMAQSRMGQALAAMERDRAAAGKYEADAAETTAKTGILQGRPDLFEEQVAAASGVDVPTVQGYRTRLRTGSAPQVPMGPETEDGEMGRGSMQFPPEVATKLAGALQQFLPVLANSGDLKPDDMARAAQMFRESGLSDRIISGALDRNRVGGAQAAVAGKPLFNADATGAVLDQYAGALDLQNPLAQSTIGLRKDQAGAQRANAAQTYASADASRASAAKTRAETDMDPTNGGQKAPKGYRWTVTGALEPIPGGPADASTKTGAPTEDERKAAGWVQQAQFAFDNMSQVLAKDPRAAKPSIMAEVAGAIPGIGEASRNSLNTEARQQFEQAAGSFAEAALRAATGAGVNESEAKQKIRELTPQLGDKAAVIAQKRQALDVYLKALRSRAGRALPQPQAAAPGVDPGAAADDPLGLR